MMNGRSSLSNRYLAVLSASGLVSEFLQFFAHPAGSPSGVFKIELIQYPHLLNLSLSSVFIT